MCLPVGLPDRGRGRRPARVVDWHAGPVRLRDAVQLARAVRRGSLGLIPGRLGERLRNQFRDYLAFLEMPGVIVHPKDEAGLSLVELACPPGHNLTPAAADRLEASVRTWGAIDFTASAEGATCREAPSGASLLIDSPGIVLGGAAGAWSFLARGSQRTMLHRPVCPPG
jgi:hypothetical protein